MTTEQATDSMMPSGVDQQAVDQQVVEKTVEERIETNVEQGVQQATESYMEPVHVAHNELWKIIVHNDEVTPYDFVINILGDLFMLSEELADHVAWTAHTKGIAVVVTRPRVEAEKLVKVAHGRARQVSYPLTFSLEQE